MEDNRNKEGESDLSTCRLCEKIKLRRYVGKYPNGRDKMYLDEDGLQWNGRKCGACQKDKSKVNMRRLRRNEKDGIK